MIRHLTIAVLAVTVGVLPGCEEQSSLYTDDPYDSTEVRKARDQAKIQAINNDVALRQAKNDVLLEAARRNVILTGNVDIGRINYKAVDTLLRKLRSRLGKDSPILVASFVNLDNLEQSSSLGRLVSEQFASRFKEKGYTTIEMKLRTTVFIKKGSGEFLLSRELSEIGIKHRAQAVVVGTYAAGADRLYLTARVVNVNDSTILAAHDYTMPMSLDVFKMLIKGEEGVDWL